MSDYLYSLVPATIALYVIYTFNFVSPLAQIANQINNAIN